MSALLLLLVCLLLGALVARFAKPPAGMVPSLNWWVINIALPALLLKLLPGLKVDTRLWFPVVAMGITFFGAWLLFALVGKKLGWSRGRIGTLTLVCGLGNTAFMGYPMVQGLHGDAGLALAVVADQFGTFPLLTCAGVFVASFYSGKAPQPREIARRIFVFPPFWATITGIVIGHFGGWPAWMPIDQVLKPIGVTLTPLALFSVGLQLRFRLDRQKLPALSIGLAWKLALAPLAVWLFGRVTQMGGLPLSVSVLQAAMAPMITASIMADEHKLEPALSNAVLGIGIVLSLFTVPLINLLLGH